MKSKVLIFNQFPPTLRVRGERIKVLLEYDDTETILKKLDQWGISYLSGYVELEEILSHIREENATRIVETYTPKSERSKQI